MKYEWRPMSPAYGFEAYHKPSDEYHVGVSVSFLEGAWWGQDPMTMNNAKQYGPFESKEAAMLAIELIAG